MSHQNLIFQTKIKIPQRNNSYEIISLDGKIELMTNHVLLILGLTFNFLIIIVIVLNHSMHKSTSCYILSIILSNLILLLDTLRNVLTWWYNIEMLLNIPYIINLTFNGSILTLGTLTIDRYIFINKGNSLSNLMYCKISQLKTAAKAVVIIWTISSIITAMEFHLYSKFKRNEEYANEVDPRIQIFVIFTFIFMVMPMVLIFWLGSLLIYEMEQLRMIAGVNKEDVESLRLLGE